MFLGPDGLRAGWRFLLYAAMARGLQLLLRIILYYAQGHDTQLWLDLMAELALVFVAVSPAFLMARLERRPFDSFGLPRATAFGRSFSAGVGWGIGSLTILLLIMHVARVFDFGSLALHGVRILKFAVFWAAFFLAVGLYEEFLIRGYTQFTLTQALGFWPSAILLSLGFGALHLSNPGENWTGIAGAVCIGLFFCLTLRRTGSLWFAVGFHASWDWGESYVYSVPDSGGVAPGHLLHSSLHGSRWLTGGSVGPEGSVFLFLLLVLLWVAFDRMYPEVKYPVPTIKTADSGL